MMVVDAVLVFVLNTLITGILVYTLDKRIDDTNRRFENRIKEIERKLEELRQEIKKPKEDFDWNKLL